MTQSVCVYGLWHLGCVTAACLAAQGCRVVGLDPDAETVACLQRGQPPIAEPDLADLIQAQIAKKTLSFTCDAGAAIKSSDVLWVAFDTPVDETDQADVGWVRAQLEAVRPHLRPGTLIVVSAQVPVGFTRSLEQDWKNSDPTLRFAVAPENLRLGRAVEAFQKPDRVVVGLGQDTTTEQLEQLFWPVRDRLQWMSLESAEMSKHALNSLLAVSIVFTNELARVCEQVGADAADVERSLRAEARVGPKAYVTPGGPIAGGTLARDVAFLQYLAQKHAVSVPLLSSVLESNQTHSEWVRERVLDSTHGVSRPRVALLGLTYKPGTDTLRRSYAVELARSLVDRGVAVQAYDPAVHRLPDELSDVRLTHSLADVLDNADVAVLATEWPEFKALDVDFLVQKMRFPRLIDQTGFLSQLGSDDRIQYVRVGRPRRAGVLA